jgi:hypothetical protein
MALHAERLAALRVLLEAGAPLAAEATNAEKGEPPLMVRAVGMGDEVLEMLLAAGGDANAKGQHGQPVIFETLYLLDRMRLLVKYGADVNAVDMDPMHQGQSLVMRLARESQWQEAQFVLEKGADVTYKAANGETLAAVLEVAPGGEAAAIAAKIAARRN